VRLHRGDRGRQVVAREVDGVGQPLHRAAQPAPDARLPRVVDQAHGPRAAALEGAGEQAVVQEAAHGDLRVVEDADEPAGVVVVAVGGDDRVEVDEVVGLVEPVLVADELVRVGAEPAVDEHAPIVRGLDEDRVALADREEVELEHPLALALRLLDPALAAAVAHVDAPLAGLPLGAGQPLHPLAQKNVGGHLPARRRLVDRHRRLVGEDVVLVSHGAPPSPLRVCLQS